MLLISGWTMRCFRPMSLLRIDSIQTPRQRSHSWAGFRKAAFEADGESEVCPYDALPEGWLGLDIGPETRARFADEISRAKTIFWNGPMGVFEWPRFAAGTKAVAEAVARAHAFSVVGGADSIRALNELGLTDQVSWASTGGGAALELLEGKELPGVAVIPQS